MKKSRERTLFTVLSVVKLKARAAVYAFIALLAFIDAVTIDTVATIVVRLPIQTTFRITRIENKIAVFEARSVADKVRIFEIKNRATTLIAGRKMI